MSGPTDSKAATAAASMVNSDAESKGPAVAVAPPDEAGVSDNAELKALLLASASASALPPLRRLFVDEVPYSGATLAEVLIERRVLSLTITTPICVAAESLTLPPRASADDLLVTRLEIGWPPEDRAGYVKAGPIGALITSFASLTAVGLSLSHTSVGSELFKMLCAALQSPRGPALETLVLLQPDLQAGAAAAFAAALRVRQNRTLRELHLQFYFGSNADITEVVRALKSAQRLQTLETVTVKSWDEGMPCAALIELLTGNDTRSRHRYRYRCWAFSCRAGQCHSVEPALGAAGIGSVA
jgi:hypothetical protein